MGSMLTSKLRPNTWEEVAGQKENIKLLKAIVKNPTESPRTLILEGEYGCGKCVSGDTRVHTSKGYLKIQDIPRDDKFDSEGFAVCNDVYVKGMYKASHFYRGGVKDTIKLKSRRFDLEGTPNHRVKVLDDNGVTWKYLNDVVEGDYICLDREGDILFNNTTKKPKFLEGLSERDYGYFLGFYLGDGTCDKDYKGMSICCNLEESSYLQSLVTTVNWLEGKVSEGGKCLNLRFNSIEDLKEFSELGLGRVSYEKVIPEWVYTSNKEFIIGLLSGLIDTDGHIERFEFTTVSKSLAYGVRDLFNLLGVYPSIKENDITYDYIKECNHEGKKYSLYVLLSEFEDLKFLDLRTYKKNALVDILRTRESQYLKDNNDKKDEILRCSKYNNIINDMYTTIKLHYKLTYKDITFKEFKQKTKSLYLKGRKCSSFTRRAWKEFRDNLPTEYKDIKTELDKDLESFRFSRVTDVGRGRCEVFDLHVPITHRFMANGLINHNTTCARILAKELNGIKDPNYDLNNSPFYYEYDATVIGNVAEIRKLRDSFGVGYEDFWKVVVFDECHVVSNQAQTALLKVLEDVSDKVIFCFCTTHIHKVLPTIRSRSLEMFFNTISITEVVEYLTKLEDTLGKTIPQDVKELVAHRSKGHMRNALILVDKFFMVGEEDFKEIVIFSDMWFCEYFKAIQSKDNESVMKIADKLLSFPLNDIQDDFSRFILEGIKVMNGLVSDNGYAIETVRLLGVEFGKVVKLFFSDWFLSIFNSEYHFKGGLLHIYNVLSKSVATAQPQATQSVQSHLWQSKR